MIISLLIHILKLLLTEVTIDYFDGNQAFMLYCFMFVNGGKRNFYSNIAGNTKQLEQMLYFI